MKIGNFDTGKRVLIIAEMGNNHEGSYSRAEEMIGFATEAGVDAVKFQTFCAEEVVTSTAPKAAYQEIASSGKESQIDMLKKLELDKDAHRKLLIRCEKKGIKFLSTPFDLKSVDMLVDLGLETFKIPSGEITNLPVGKEDVRKL